MMPSTRWDWVAALKGGAMSDEARRALALLCDGYWFPIYARLRGMGHGPEDAEDLTQGFFEKLLRTNAFERASPEKGRLRNLLLASLKRYVATIHEARTSLKRGGKAAVHLPIFSAWAEERLEAEEPASPAPSPEAEFNRRWWKLLVDRAFGNVQAEYARRGQGDLAARLRPFLDDSGAPSVGMDDLARQLGARTASLRVALLRLKRRLAEEVRRIVRETVGSDEAAQEEIKFFLAGR